MAESMRPTEAKVTGTNLHDTRAALVAKSAGKVRASPRGASEDSNGVQGIWTLVSISQSAEDDHGHSVERTEVRCALR